MPQSQTAQIVFAKDEHSTLPPNVSILLKAYKAYTFAKQSLEEVSQYPIPQNIMDTLGSKEEIQSALADSANTLNLALNNCSERDIQKLDIDEPIKQEMIIMRRQKDLNLMRKHKNIELER